MSQRANYFKLGVFVLSCVSLGAFAVIALSAGALFEQRLKMETFLDESVQGLELGSPVKYRGVQIGNVEKIETALHRYRGLGVTRRRFVRVVMSLYTDAFTHLTEGDASSTQDFVDREAKQGLRVRLTSQGLTGIAYLEIDYLNPAPRRVVLVEGQGKTASLRVRYTDLTSGAEKEVSLEPEFVYCPSAPSTLTRIGAAVNDGIKMFKDLELPATMDKLSRTLVTVEKAITDLQVGDLSADVRELVGSVDDAIGKSDVAAISSEVVLTLRELRESNARLRELLDKPEVDKIPEDIAASTASLRKLITDKEGELETLISDARAAMTSLKNTAAEVEGALGKERVATAADEISKTAGQVRKASEDLPETVAELKTALRRINRLLVTQSQTISALLVNFKAVSADLRDISGRARRYPSQLLFGAPPPARKRD